MHQAEQIWWGAVKMNKIILFGIIGLVAAVLILAAVKADINKSSIVDRMNNMHKQMQENFKDDPKLLTSMDKMHESMIKQIEKNPDKEFNCPMMGNMDSEDMGEMHKAMHGNGRMGMMQ